MTDMIVKATLGKIGTLATLPDVAIRIMQVADDPAATEDAMHDVLVSDPTLATRVLKVVNSAFYRREREVTTPRAAIRLLGVEAIRSIALAASLHRLFRRRISIGDFDPATLWSHSVAVGIAARSISRKAGFGLPEEAMLAGLLHDIGIIVAMQAWPAESAEVIRRARESDSATLREVELEEIGATHEQFGAALCERWKFPSFLAAACRYHHDFSVASGEERKWGALIHVADTIVMKLESGMLSAFENGAQLRVAVDTLDIDPISLGELENEISAELPSAALLAA